MTLTALTAEDMMVIAAARRIADGAICFVGIGLPSLAANLARHTYAPNAKLIYESGPIGSKPTVPPQSIGDGELAETADFTVSVPEMFAYWLQGGRIDIGFLGACEPSSRTSAYSNPTTPETSCWSHCTKMPHSKTLLATGWPLRVADGLEVTPTPTPEERGMLAELRTAQDNA
jgi:hypothetical protein